MSLASFYRSIAVALLALAPLSPAIASPTADGSDGDLLIAGEIDAQTIALRAEDSLRADRTFMRARVTIRSSRGAKERVIEFECWNDRVERRSFIRILAPDSDTGVALLNLPPNLWRYAPELERTELIFASALLEPWMGSDFAIGDLIDPFSDIEDYEVELLEVEEPSEGAAEVRSHVVQYTRMPAARAAWEKFVAWIEAEGGVPMRREFYDANGERLRTIYFSDVRSVAGRRVPHRWKAVSAGKKGRESILEIRDLRFEAAFDDAIFTTENLKPAQDANPDE
jgi:outer membrane lipoprotein-sorting protein